MSKNAVINLLNLPLYCQVTLSSGGLGARNERQEALLRGKKQRRRTI